MRQGLIAAIVIGILACFTLCAAISILLRRYRQWVQCPSQELDIERAYVPEAAFHSPATRRRRSDGMPCSPTEIELRARFTFTLPSRDDPIYEGPTARSGNYVYGGSLLSNVQPVSQESPARDGYEVIRVNGQPRLQKIKGHNDREQSSGDTSPRQAKKRPKKSIRRRPRDTLENMKEQWPPQARVTSNDAAPVTEVSQSARARLAINSLLEQVSGLRHPNNQTTVEAAQSSDQSSKSGSSNMERMSSRSTSLSQSGNYLALEPFAPRRLTPPEYLGSLRRTVAAILMRSGTTSIAARRGHQQPPALTDFEELAPWTPSVERWRGQ